MPIGLTAFRALWLSRAVSFTGDGVAQVALVLLAAPAGPEAVALVLLVNTVPRLLGPVAGAIADRVDQRRLLAACELGQCAVYAALALLTAHGTTSPAVVLPLVATAGGLATLFSPAGKSSVPRLVSAAALPRANAMLGAAFNLQVLAGPALGGLLVGVGGPALAFGVDAASFAASALLLTRLPPLPPAAPADRSLLGGTADGLRYLAHAAVPRALALGTLLLVAFAAMDNVALVFLVQQTLRGSAAEYGFTVAAFGAGMLGTAVLLTRLAGRRRPQTWLVLGPLAGAAGTAATACAPGIALAVAGQALAGAGNTAELVGSDTVLQQQVPRHLLGRVFGGVGTAAQIGAGLAYAAAGPLVAATGPRAALLIAAGGSLLALAVFVPALRPGTNGTLVT